MPTHAATYVDMCCVALGASYGYQSNMAVLFLTPIQPQARITRSFFSGL